MMIEKEEQIIGLVKRMAEIIADSKKKKTIASFEAQFLENREHVHEQIHKLQNFKQEFHNKTDRQKLEETVELLKVSVLCLQEENDALKRIIDEMLEIIRKKMV